MGKFLRDSSGNLVAIQGGLVLERTLDRKPRDCQSCGFSKWAKKDKVFIIQGGSGTSTPEGKNNDGGSANATGAFLAGGSMEWVCPDCALKRGLPVEFYHKNFFSPGNADARRYQEQKLRAEQQKQQQTTNGAGISSLPQGIEKILDMTSSLCHFWISAEPKARKSWKDHNSDITCQNRKLVRKHEEHPATFTFIQRHERKGKPWWSGSIEHTHTNRLS